MRAAVAICALFGPIAASAASWTFADGQITVQEKGAGVGGARTESLTPNKPITTKAMSLTPADTLKITLTTRDGSTARRPHQAFLQLQDVSSGLSDAYPFSVKDSGKGKVEISQKDIPYQLLAAKQPIQASIIIASFGSSAGYEKQAFDLEFLQDPSAPLPSPAPVERYGKQSEIHHIFRDDPKSPPRLISLVFTLAVLGMLPVLIGCWTLLGANVEQASVAIKTHPIAHALFFGSVLAMEGVFVLYYLSWNLFQTLPAAAVVGVIAYISGSRALTEVQDRRLAGKR